MPKLDTQKLIFLGILLVVIASGITFFYFTTGEQKGIADLQIVKTADKESVKIGDTLTYTAAVTNLGPATANQVTVTDHLPFGVNIQSVTSEQGKCEIIVGIPICDVETLQANQSAAVKIVVVIGDAATSLMNTARVASSGNNNDPLENNRADLETRLIFLDEQAANKAKQKQQGGPNPPTDVADLALSITADKESVQVGEVLTYTLNITNLGPNTAQGVLISDYLPEGVTVQSLTKTQGICLPTAVFSRTIVCGAPDLNPQESFGIVMEVLVNQNALGKSSDIIVNDAEVEAFTRDTKEDNNEDVVITDLNVPPSQNKKVAQPPATKAKISYGGFSCGFEEAILEGPIDTGEVLITFLPETDPENGIVVLKGGYPSYEAIHVALFPSDIESPTNNLVKVTFSKDDSVITLRGIDRKSGFQLCTGIFEKGVAPESGGLQPLKVK